MKKTLLYIGFAGLGLLFGGVNVIAQTLRPATQPAEKKAVAPKQEETNKGEADVKPTETTTVRKAPQTEAKPIQAKPSSQKEARATLSTDTAKPVENKGTVQQKNPTK